MITYNRKTYEFLIGYLFIFLSAVSAIISIVISLTYSAPRVGLEYLFMLPILFLSFIFISYKVYLIRYRTFALPVFFTILIFRYAISPALIYITRELNYTRMVPNANNYQLAVIVSIFELLFVFIALNIYYKRYNTGKIISFNIFNNKIGDPKSINIYQLLIILFLTMFLIARNENFVDGLYFLIPNDSYYNSGAYEGIVFLALKTFLFLKILVFAKSQTKFRLFFFLLSVIFFLINVSLSYGNNRSLIVINFLSSVIVFINAYPKQSKIIMLGIVPIVSLFILSLIFFKQFGDNLGIVMEFDIPVQKLSEDIEMYINGMWPLASSFEIIENGFFSNSILIVQIYTDFVKNFFPFLIPGFNFPISIVSNINTTAMIYNLNTNGIGAMFPLAGQIFSYFGFYFGFIINIAANFYIIKLLVRYDFLSVRSKSLELSYYYNWLSILFAFVMNYTLITFVWSWSKNIFLIYLLIMVGRIMVPKLRFRK